MADRFEHEAEKILKRKGKFQHEADKILNRLVASLQPQSGPLSPADKRSIKKSITSAIEVMLSHSKLQQEDFPPIVLQASIVSFSGSVAEGHLVEAVSIPWFEILGELGRDPAYLHRIDWRKMEELIAGAYKQAGFSEVILTPRSNDKGRDIIASKPGVGSIRIIDQVKKYKPGNLVTADEVRAMLGVLTLDRNVSKAVITTTSGFAPGVLEDPELQAFVPYRLELKDGGALNAWLHSLLEASSLK